jgi:hypothetical protein
MAGHEDLLRHSVAHDVWGGLAVDLSLRDGRQQVIARVG